MKNGYQSDGQMSALVEAVRMVMNEEIAGIRQRVDRLEPTSTRLSIAPTPTELVLPVPTINVGEGAAEALRLLADAVDNLGRLMGQLVTLVAERLGPKKMPVMLLETLPNGDKRLTPEEV